MSEQEQRQHPYAYNLRFATKDLESHERIAFTVADAMIHAKEFDTMHQRIAALESELAATKRECEGLREAARETPNRIRELSQFVDPKHHEKFHQLADVMETLMPEAARDATEGGA